MKLISITAWTPEVIAGYVADTRNYKHFHLWAKAQAAIWGPPMPRRRYKSLRWFAEVIGKFDPDAFVLDKPLVIDAAVLNNFSALDGILRKDKRFTQGEVPVFPEGEG
jgi:hypothetical protein